MYLGRQVFAGGGDGEFAVLHAFGGDEFVGDLLYQGGMTADDEDLQAIVVVEVDVQGGNNHRVVVVLDIGEGGLDVLFVVVVKEGDGAGDFLVTEILAVLDEAGADEVGDGKRAVTIAFLVGHLVELFGQGTGNGDSETDNAFGFVILHRTETSRGGRAVNDRARRRALTRPGSGVTKCAIVHTRHWQNMHIPDGFLDGKVIGATAALSLAGVGVAVRQVRLGLPARRVPLLGLSAAFLFTAQMLNFPVAGGTSGHLIGGVLVAALLGPAAGVVVLTTVLIVQSVVFGDGGVTALGANVFNMALTGTLCGWAIYRGVRRVVPGLRGQVAGVAFGGWCSAVLASLACAGELAGSSAVPWLTAVVAMTGVHMLIGLGEGLISALVFLAIARARPDLVSAAQEGTAASRVGMLVGSGLVVSLGLAAFVAPFACPWPDGLEKVAARLGFEHKSADILKAPLANYVFPGCQSPVLATAIAGVVGALVVFGLALLLSRALVRERG